MKITSVLCLSLITLFSSTLAQAADSTWNCTMGKVTRKVEVKYTTAGKKVPCQVIYTKGDEAEGKSIFSANSKEGYCEESAKNFVTKLEGMKYECK